LRKIIMASTLKPAAAIAALAVALSPAAALAHHGWSQYSETPQQTTGVIRAVHFANPHATLQLEAQGRTWLVFLAPPSRMTSRGLPQGTLKAGQTATVEGYVHRTSQNEMRAEWISLDGTRTPLR
jgi:hypothetical protein